MGLFSYILVAWTSVGWAGTEVRFPEEIETNPGFWLGEQNCSRSSGGDILGQLTSEHTWHAQTACRELGTGKVGIGYQLVTSEQENLQWELSAYSSKLEKSYPSQIH